ncbi:MAG TPA: chemotaxis protein CheA [Bacillales bacterium]|nr:chemotaxis protein CheA [Bacillales bacterium]
METEQYLDMFLDESREHLQLMNDGLLALEKQPSDLQVVQEIFRGAHTLKGMSASMGFTDMAELTHKLENVLDAVRNLELPVTTEVIDILLEGADRLELMTDDLSSGGDGSLEVAGTVEKLNRLLEGESGAEASAAGSGDSETFAIDQYKEAVIRQSQDEGFSAFVVRVVLNEDCMLKAARSVMVFQVLENIGEIVHASPSVEQIEEEAFDQAFSVLLLTQQEKETIESHIMNVSEIENVEISDWVPAQSANEAAVKSESDKPSGANQTNSPSKRAKANDAGRRTASKTIRVNIERLDQLMNLFEELVIDKSRLQRLAKEIKNHELTEVVERMTRISGNMQEMILALRMVPIDQVFGRFPKMVRDLSKDLNKKIRFHVTGAETELDRTVVDEIGDPLIHLLRNSLDHGIESPEARVKKGKSEEGTIEIHAYYSGNHVLIEIKDDGAGINREAVLKKAVENGVVGKEEAEELNDKQVYELLFASGFSTAEKISDLSGRGVGLDVVKNKIESLSGRVDVDSEPDKGTTFTIQLPLTLSIIPVMLVQVGAEIYAVPLSSIVEIAVIGKDDVYDPHHHKMVHYRGKMIPLLTLREQFQVEEDDPTADTYPIVIVRKGEKFAALQVDAFIGHQEVVLKSLGDYFTQIPGISGATILGNGEAALIIDCNTLIP